MSAYPAYNFGSAAPKRQEYDRYAFEVLPGGHRDKHAQTQAQPSVVSLVVKALVAVVVLFTVIGVVRITLSSATVAAAIEANQVSSAIEQARANGNTLEVTQSTLSNPTRIKSEASAIGMAVPEQTTIITLPQDVVVKDSAGNLSLSGSVAASAGVQG